MGKIEFTNPASLQETSGFVRVLFSLFACLSVTGNTLVILSILQNRSMRTNMNFLLLNLAVANALVAIFLLPRYVFNDVIQYPQDGRADLVCKFLTAATISWVGLHAQIFTFVMISFERYTVVVRRCEPSGQLTKPKLKIALVCCWFVAIGFIVPDLVSLRYSFEKETCLYEWPYAVQKAWAFIWFFTCGPIPLCTMGYLYGRVVHELWIKKSQATNSSRAAIIALRKRVTKVVITVTILFTLCCLPNLILWSASNFVDSIPYAHIFMTVTHLFLLLNSSINPLVYSLQSEHFRKCMLRTMCFCKPMNTVMSEQDVNPNSLSAQVTTDCTRVINCMESRAPSGIKQELYESLEQRKRRSLARGDNHTIGEHSLNMRSRSKSVNTNQDLSTENDCETSAATNSNNDEDLSSHDLQQRLKSVDSDYGSVWMGEARAKNRSVLPCSLSSSMLEEEKLDDTESGRQTPLQKSRSIAVIAAVRVQRENADETETPLAEICSEYSQTAHNNEDDFTKNSRKTNPETQENKCLKEQDRETHRSDQKRNENASCLLVQECEIPYFPIFEVVNSEKQSEERHFSHTETR